MLWGGAVISGIEVINSKLYPMPDGLSVADSEAMKEWISTLPTPAFGMLLAGWSLGTFSGVWVARRLARKRSQIPGIFVAAAFLIATILNLLMMPHPLWLWPAAFVCLPAVTILGLVFAAPASYQVSADRQISSSIENVFETLSQAEQFSKAVPGIQSIEFLTEQREGVGTKFRETRLMNGKEAATELEITELDENHRIRMVSDAGGTIWDTVFTVQETGAGTQLRMVMDAKPQAAFAKVLTPCILPIVDRAVQDDMDAIREYCQSQTAQSCTTER